MKVRERLFLRVGGLFFVIFTASLVVQSQIISKIFLRAEKKLHTDFLQVDEEKRERIEKFIFFRLTEESSKSSEFSEVVLKEITRELSLSSNGASLLIQNGQPTLYYSREGIPQPMPPLSTEMLTLLLNNNTGIISFQGQNYVFLRMHPVQNAELFFYM